METLTLEHLKELAQQGQEPKTSIYMPTVRAGADVQQNAIRFKNLLRRAAERLRERGMRPPKIDTLLQPAQALLEQTDFWLHQYDGLAVFIGKGDFRYFRLPYTVSEELVVNTAYYLKPLLPLVTNDGHFYILAVSQNQVRMYEATRDTIGEIDLPAGTPLSMDEAMRFDDPERQLQMRTSVPPGGQQGGSGVYHGHVPKDDDKANIERYLNEVDMGVQKLLHNQQAPLVLAGVEYMLSIYQQASEYKGLIPEGITGNPDVMQPQELHASAWEIVEPLFRQEMETAFDRYREMVAKGIGANHLNKIVPAAYFARVETLFVASDSEPIWGRFDPETGRVTRNPDGAQHNPDDIPLTDFAATYTLLNGGMVYGLVQADMPDDTPLAAIYRY